MRSLTCVGRCVAVVGTTTFRVVRRRRYATVELTDRLYRADRVARGRLANAMHAGRPVQQAQIAHLVLLLCLLAAECDLPNKRPRKFAAERFGMR